MKALYLFGTFFMLLQGHTSLISGDYAPGAQELCAVQTCLMELARAHVFTGMQDDIEAYRTHAQPINKPNRNFKGLQKLLSHIQTLMTKYECEPKHPMVQQIVKLIMLEARERLTADLMVPLVNICKSISTETLTGLLTYDNLSGLSLKFWTSPYKSSWSNKTIYDELLPIIQKLRHDSQWLREAADLYTNFFSKPYIAAALTSSGLTQVETYPGVYTGLDKITGPYWQDLFPITTTDPQAVRFKFISSDMKKWFEADKESDWPYFYQDEKGQLHLLENEERAQFYASFMQHLSKPDTINNIIDTWNNWVNPPQSQFAENIWEGSSHFGRSPW